MQLTTNIQAKSKFFMITRDMYAFVGQKLALLSNGLFLKTVLKTLLYLHERISTNNSQLITQKYLQN